MKETTIEISLTPMQWVEVYYCLDSKLTNVKNGCYRECRGSAPDKKWINQLCDIMDEIETKVEV